MRGKGGVGEGWRGVRGVKGEGKAAVCTHLDAMDCTVVAVRFGGDRDLKGVAT